MKVNKANLALMCKSKNFIFETGNRVRVGNWVISESRRKELHGGNVILTTSQKSPAYLGGKIIGFNPTHEGKCEVVFKEDETLIGNTDSVSHAGWGSGRGVCYI